MKNVILLVASIAVGAVMITCSGGGGSKNSYLGNLPGLYEKFDKAEAGLKASIEGKGMDAIVKAYADMKIKEDQLKADVAAEMEKLAGTELPVSYSPELQKSSELWYDAKGSLENGKGKPYLKLVLTAKNDHTIPSVPLAEAKKSWICYHFVDKNGASIEGTKWSVTLVEFPAWGAMLPEKSFARDEVVYDKSSYMDVEKNPAAWVDFAGVQFVTIAEYDAL